MINFDDRGIARRLDPDFSQVAETTTVETLPLVIDSGPRLYAAVAITTRVTWMPTSFPLSDPHWEHIDKAGHWHGFTDDAPLLPTLESDGWFQRCHGCADVVCRGWHPPVHRCRLCGEIVTPVFRYDGGDLDASAIPTVGGWFADLRLGDNPPDAARVQVRIFARNGDVLIGAATVEPAGRLLGLGKLATRSAAALRPRAFHQVGPA